MLEELREFCEDNNLVPPAPLQRSRPIIELLWSASDLPIEGDAVRLEKDERSFVLGRVAADLHYVLHSGGVEFERGAVPDLAVALEVAEAWLSGKAGYDDLPRRRRPLI